MRVLRDLQAADRRPNAWRSIGGDQRDLKVGFGSLEEINKAEAHRDAPHYSCRGCGSEFTLDEALAD